MIGGAPLHHVAPRKGQLLRHEMNRLKVDGGRRIYFCATPGSLSLARPRTFSSSHTEYHAYLQLTETMGQMQFKILFSAPE